MRTANGPWLPPRFSVVVMLAISIGVGCKSSAPNAKPETEVKAPSAAATPSAPAAQSAPATSAPARADATAPPPNEVRATGYDLYSWKVGSWYFALLPGMNRLRSSEEVKAPATTIDGLSALKSRLKQLERGTKVTWSANVPGTELPTTEIVSELSAYSAQHGIGLSVKQ